MNPFIRMPVIIALLVVVITFIILKFTKGASLYACRWKVNSLAKLMGLNVKKTKMKKRICYLHCFVLSVEYYIV